MTLYYGLATISTILLSRTILGLEYTSQGVSGETCGPFGKKCIAGQAYCDPATNSCKCLPPFDLGQGDIRCVAPNTIRAELVSDLHVRTFDGVSTPLLPIPCRYSLSRTVTELRNPHAEVVGACEFWTFAFHQKNRGKFYVAGYDVAIKVTYDNGTEKAMSIRTYGKARNGFYDFIIHSTDNEFNPHGNWYNDLVDFHDPSTDLTIKIDFDQVNNLATLAAEKCGVNIQFRPYDFVLHRYQPQISHLTISIDSAHNPMFKNLEESVALSPTQDENGRGITINGRFVSGLRTEEAFMARALSSGAVQNFPEFEEEKQCSWASNKVFYCHSLKLPLAMNRCSFILRLPRFVHCYDPTESGVEIMKLFNSCLDVFCQRKPCQEVINTITASGCHKIHDPYPEVDVFISGDRCP